MPSRSATARTTDRTAFTLPELLVVIGVIAAVLAFLFPALSGVLQSGKMAGSLNNMRQIATMMELYSRENREAVLPSQFDYSAAQFQYKGKVRSFDPPPLGTAFAGTWCDILWTLDEKLAAGITKGVSDTTPAFPEYQFDSPDAVYYAIDPGYGGNPFRSTATNTEGVLGGTGALPYGSGADEEGDPGYFAANDFFNARPDHPDADPAGIGRWFKTGQIKAPNRSMYLVDSFAGEVIDDDEVPWDVSGETTQIDFRYNDMCTMLFLDGHTQQEGIWGTIDDLETGRQIRIRNLTSN